MQFENYTIPQGKIMVAFCDENLSVGTLELNPGQELSKHNRPCLESLFQLDGTCVMKLFESDSSVTDVTLNKGGQIEISAGKFHIHSNPTDKKSITFWKASGDIREIIENIRKSNKM